MRSFGATFCSLAFACLLLAGATSAARGADQFAMVFALAVDRVVVVKSQRRMMLLQDDDVIRVYRIALGRNPSGAKVREGDARTPEGSYELDGKITNSNFYKAIHISYPNMNDMARANMLGVEPGGRIMIHGLPNEMTAARVGHPVIDWTQGCIAVTNGEMDEIWRLVEPGTPIEIRP